MTSSTLQKCIKIVDVFHEKRRFLKNVYTSTYNTFGQYKCPSESIIERKGERFQRSAAVEYPRALAVVNKKILMLFVQTLLSNLELPYIYQWAKRNYIISYSMKRLICNSLQFGNNLKIIVTHSHVI